MKAVIVGGGIGGLCTAIALQQTGIEATVYEAAPELRPVGAGVGLAANAIQGLQRLGVSDKVIARGEQLEALVIFDEHRNVISNFDTKPLSKRYGVNNFVIHRADLHEVLYNQLQPSSLVLNKRCAGIKQLANKVEVTFTDGSNVTADLLIAADGINSAIRQQLLPKSKPRYAGYTCWRGVVENPDVDINTSISAEMWAPQGRVGMAPLQNNTIYWYACVNAKQNDPVMRQMSPEQLAAHFANVYEPVATVLAATKAAQMIWNDITDLDPLKRFAFGNIVLLGDAAHATTPNMGQGACQAIEDAVVLGQCLRQQSTIQEALMHYEKRRLTRTAKVIRMSRLLGAVSQWQHPLMIGVRNNIFKITPDFVNQSQMEELYKVDF